MCVTAVFVLWTHNSLSHLSIDSLGFGDNATPLLLLLLPLTHCCVVLCRSRLHDFQWIEIGVYSAFIISIIGFNGIKKKRKRERTNEQTKTAKYKTSTSLIACQYVSFRVYIYNIIQKLLSPSNTAWNLNVQVLFVLLIVDYFVFRFFLSFCFYHISTSLYFSCSMCVTFPQIPRTA